MEEKPQKTPQEKPKKCISYECIECCFITSHKNNYNKHLMTAKHKKCKKMQKNAKENTKIPICYQCIDCNFITNNKNNYNKHLGTIKHSEKCKKEKTSIEETNETEMNELMIITDKKLKKTPKNSKKLKINYECIDCCFITSNKNDYNRHLITIKHLKKCEKKQEINENLTEKLIKTLIEQNKLVLNEVKESQEKMVEQNKLVLNEVKEIAKDGKTINNTINNSFNLNFFLNETCKDAISIEDCINSIEINDDKFYLLSTFEKSGAKRG